MVMYIRLARRYEECKAPYLGLRLFIACGGLGAEDGEGSRFEEQLGQGQSRISVYSGELRER
jgi:hypothetical protein